MLTLQSPQTVWTRTDDALNITLANNVLLQFSLDNERLRGLSGVFINELPLMAPGSLRLPHLETRDGWSVHHYRLVDVLQRGEGVTLVTDLWAVRPAMGRRLDMFQNAYLANPVLEPVRTGVMHWHFEPVTRTLGHSGVRQTVYQGLSYSYELQLMHVFHWVLDAGSWELGGDPEGVSLLSQHKSPIAGPMEFLVSRQGDSYQTGETFPKEVNTVNLSDVFADTANDPSERYIIPIQAQLRGAGGALLDTQWKEDAVLLSFFEDADYYRTLVDWRPDAAAIAHLDLHYFPLTTQYTTPAKIILAAQVPDLTRLTALNLWTDAFDHVGNCWRGALGMGHVAPEPSFGLDCCGGAGVHLGYGPADLLEKWEEQLPWLEEQGFKSFFLAGIGNHRGHELPGVANLCQPYDYRVHERYGGPERFRQFCERAHQHGMTVVMWVGVPSAHAPVLVEHPEWIIRYDSGAAWDGNYVTLNSASLHRGFDEWLLDEARYLKELGVDGLYFDSYHNLWAMPVDYGRPDLRPQFKDVMTLQARLEEMGLRTSIESVGPLGQSSIGLWSQYGEHPEMCYRLQMAINASGHVSGRPNQFQDGTVPLAFYWRMLALGSCLGIGVMDFDNEPHPGVPAIPLAVGRMNQILNQLQAVMQIRTLQEDGSVRWDNPASGEYIEFSSSGGSLSGDVGGNSPSLDLLRACGYLPVRLQH